MKPTHTATAALVIAFSVASPTHAQTLALTFTGEPEFDEAIEEYRALWADEGDAIVEVLERASGLEFTLDAMPVQVMEGPSWAGTTSMGMRASYPFDTKRATLAHELGHILIGERVPDPDDVVGAPDPHYVLFLFLYDAWVELWGEEFADEQVAVESRRRGLNDYEGIWREVLEMDAEERAAELRRIIPPGPPASP